MKPSSLKPLGLFKITMINIIAVDSLRNLSFSAVYGYSLVFFYLLAVLTFFIPTALVSAELGTGWPNRGGIYVWVREAFGKKWSFITIWLNWVYNLIWYPTIMALIVDTVAYLFNPELANNKLYTCLSVLILFWIATISNCWGMQLSSFVSTLGALVGNIFPMLLIVLMGAVWVFNGFPLQIQFDWAHFFPSSMEKGNLAFLTNVLFALLGLEMSATHAAEMRQPEKDYPRSLLIASIVILFTIIFGSLAIAIVVPVKELSLATGLMQAFQVFFNAYGLPWLTPLIAGCIILGGLGGVSTWIIGPTKGLLVASEDGSLPSLFSRMNAKGVPVSLLILQAVVVSFLSLLFVLLPTVNSSYWILSLVTAQLALLVYIILFASAIKLRYKSPSVVRSFRIPGNKWGIWVVCALGIFSSAAVFFFGFIPPEIIPFNSILLYELLIILGIAICLLLPISFLARLSKMSKD